MAQIYFEVSDIKLTHEELNDYIYYKDYILSRLESVDGGDELYSPDDLDKIYSLYIPHGIDIIDDIEDE